MPCSVTVVHVLRLEAAVTHFIRAGVEFGSEEKFAGELQTHAVYNCNCFSHNASVLLSQTVTSARDHLEILAAVKRFTAQSNSHLLYWRPLTSALVKHN
jgi:hypothetical protein